MYYYVIYIWTGQWPLFLLPILRVFHNEFFQFSQWHGHWLPQRHSRTRTHNNICQGELSSSHAVEMSPTGWYIKQAKEPPLFQPKGEAVDLHHLTSKLCHCRKDPHPICLDVSILLTAFRWRYRTLSSSCTMPAWMLPCSCLDDNGLNLWTCKPAPIKCCFL